ncbi:probable hexosyltransferase MUCI70 [Solanum verrucosum]|uniref:probable hexosyltransferase MUCI70 n=1 Tax=Solanum verrucosum TaxID=315347 RepID=UPI0020CFFE4A|nr:probable hexosyltransferase MUCI70 [Solanum verrucosum]
MTIASLGLRSSGSYGSLQQQQFQNGGSPFQTSPPVPPRKPPKMFKEKEGLFLWICKFAPRKKIGMMLLCVVSAAVFLWVLYVGKGEDTQELIMSMNSGVFPPDTGQIRHIDSIEKNDVGKIASIESPPPPPPPLAYFKGYTLPPGNSCEGFTLPPPPADKKRTGPRPCPVCYLPVEQAIALMPDAPSFSPGVSSLTYIHEENLSKSEFGGSEFGGYPSLMQRNDSYDVRESMSVHCGFFRGARPGHQTGFDIDDSNLLVMESCRGVVVASSIFGAFDLIRQPQNISEYAKGNVCFYMFVDEETENFLRNSSELDSSMRIGLWRIAVVHNLPYDDPRRNGKVPKLLLHRLFPNARYSLWVDAKLELVVDPYQILERFLWRKNASFAISRHYRRFDVFVEAEANKAASKFDNASIDFQVDFYRKEGLTPYTRAKLPISSDVPEGCVIIKEHIPISNLFTCLWFNEVDRFTPRDQISFAIVRDKIREKTNWTLNMFLDCERRNFVIQGYHRDVLERWPPPPPPGAIAVVHPPPPVIDETMPNVSASSFVTSPVKKIPTKRGRERKSRRHRKVIPG